MTTVSPGRILVQSEESILLIRRECRNIAKALGFSVIDETRIVTVASELSRNIFTYAQSGHVLIAEVADGCGRKGIEMVFEDSGPGIENVEEAMVQGFTTSKGLGAGFPGSKRLMDDFAIESRPGEGTKITVRKWL